MFLSVLVVSRTPDLLNKMLLSISKATCLEKQDLEILCSWNGSKSDEKKIINNSNYDFKIVQRDKYHYARNINSLVRKASGEILLTIGDDIVLDTYSIDNGIVALKSQENIGCVAGNLRYENGLIQHVGVAFDKNNHCYHKFENSIVIGNSKNINNNSKFIPAATGSLLFIKKELFNEIGFSEKYEYAGEDIELSLDIREKKDLNILFSPSVSAIHNSCATRKKYNQIVNQKDLKRIQNRRLEFLKNASKEQIILELEDLQEEIFIIKGLYINSKLKNFIKSNLKLIYFKLINLKILILKFKNKIG
jgi:GT2 family glycosyltransferase